MQQTSTEGVQEEKVVDWELCKILKFYLTIKGYKNKPNSVEGNETHKIP